MKKVGIDARLIYQTGVGVYLRNLLYYLNKFNLNKINFVVYVLKKDLKRVSNIYKNLYFKGVGAKWHTFFEQTNFLVDILKDNLDLMHFTYFSFPILYNKKYISTIHDTTLLNFKTGKASTKPSFVYNFKHIIFRYMFYKQVEKSKFIITPTESVKRQIIELDSRVDSKKIIPIYEGVTVEYKKIKKLKENIPNKYFLYVGTFYPHKNVENLIKAYSDINSDIRLYLIGPDDFFSNKINYLIKKLNLEKKVKIIRNVSQEKLPEYYKNASALIHPSKSEGFGLPIVEAMFFGIPIIASNIDVFKEILGDKYIAFNPEDIEDIRVKIQDFILKKTSFEYRELLKKFSFEKMSKETLNLYKYVLNM